MHTGTITYDIIDRHTLNLKSPDGDKEEKAISEELIKLFRTLASDNTKITLSLSA